MVGDAALRIVIGADLRRAVAGRDHGFALGGDVVDVFLVLHVVDACAQTRQGAFAVLGLVAGLGALDENLLHFSGVGVLPHITQTHARLHLVHILSASA